MLEVLLASAPLFALLCALLLGRYPGCDAIVRLSERLSGSAPDRRAGASRSRRPLAPRSFAPAGGLLIAFGHAQRPPPLPV